MPKIVFTDSSLANDILQLRNNNKTIAEIAIILNLAYNQVVYLINKFKLPKKYYWLTQKEKDFIAQNTHLGNATLAKILNRNISVISRYTNHTFFTEEEKTFIKENLHLTTYKLAKELNRSYNQTKKIKYNILN